MASERRDLPAGEGTELPDSGSQGGPPGRQPEPTATPASSGIFFCKHAWEFAGSLPCIA